MTTHNIIMCVLICSSMYIRCVENIVTHIYRKCIFFAFFFFILFNEFLTLFVIRLFILLSSNLYQLHSKMLVVERKYFFFVDRIGECYYTLKIFVHLLTLTIIYTNPSSSMKMYVVTENFPFTGRYDKYFVG